MRAIFSARRWYVSGTFAPDNTRRSFSAPDINPRSRVVHGGLSGVIVARPCFASRGSPVRSRSAPLTYEIGRYAVAEFRPKKASGAPSQVRRSHIRSGRAHDLGAVRRPPNRRRLFADVLAPPDGLAYEVCRRIRDNSLAHAIPFIYRADCTQIRESQRTAPPVACRCPSARFQRERSVRSGRPRRPRTT
jgi:hypothetical protein